MSSAPSPAMNGYTSGNGSAPAALKDSPWYVRSAVYILEKFGLATILAAGLGWAWWTSAQTARVDAKEERAAFAASLEREHDRLEAALRALLNEAIAQRAVLLEIKGTIDARSTAYARLTRRAP